MQTLRPALLRCCLVLSGAIAFSGCERISTRTVEAIVLDAHAAHDQSGTVLAGDKIAAPALIEAAANGRADLMLLPNMLMRLDGDTRLEITGLLFAADGNETEGGVRERGATAQLSGGRVVGRVEQHGYNIARLRIETSRAEMRADSNALFEITEQPEATTAACVRGHLDVQRTGPHHLSTVWPGEAIRIDAAGSHHDSLAALERSALEERCGQAEAALLLEANNQTEARR